MNIATSVAPRERNRERAPEFAEFADAMREMFDAKVLQVRFADGDEIKTKEYEREVGR